MSKKNRIGKYVEGKDSSGKKFKAYVPSFLPPNPTLELENLYEALEKANTSVGRLDGINKLLPNPEIFLGMYIRKEAVLSSQIEGTQSSLSDLLLYEENNEISIPDVVEVSSYVKAMYYGLDRLNTLPLSLRLLKEIHEILMSNSRGQDKSPGEFRKIQNWIGGELSLIHI